MGVTVARRQAARTTLSVLLLLLLSLLAAAGTAGAGGDPTQRWRFDAVDRVIAFGDVHGDHAALVTLLTHAGVIDADGNWIAGDTHLVSLGDLLDRGPESRKVMDLLMRLQQQAPGAGGRVHVVLGNHEQMNLTGDLRYVAVEEFEAFAGPEDDRLRELALQRVRKLKLDEKLVSERPPGFYAHRAAFAADGYYGRWLLAQRVLVVIGDRVYLHGGVSPLLTQVARDVDALEPALRQVIVDVTSLASEPVLQRPDLLGTNLLRIAGSSAAAQPSLPAGLAPLAPRLRLLADDPLFAANGPLWYRGNAGCHALLEQPGLDRTLQYLGVSGVVVGHTTQRDHRVRSRFDGRVLLLDTGMLNRYYGGVPRAVLFESGQAPRVLSPDGQQDTPDTARPAVYAGFDTPRLQRLLGEGEIANADGERVQVTLGEDRVQAQVLSLGKRARQHEIAAWHLDQMLGLGMVPLVVEREVSGKTVLLRVDEGEWITEDERTAAGRNPPNWCASAHPFDLVRLFDVLLGNARDVSALSYRRADLAIRLTDHADAFARTGRIVEVSLPAVLAYAASRVDAEQLAAQMDGLLDRARLKALLARHQAVLEQLGES
jgi:hypothetical protein